MTDDIAPLPFLVFDVDDTLYLERDFVKSGFDAVGRWLEAEHGLQGLAAAAWGMFEEGHRQNIFNVSLPLIGGKVDAVLIGELVEIYRHHHPDIKLEPDAKRCLERLGWSGCAAITDGYAETQQRKVDALQLDRYCSAVVRTGVWGRDFWKPHPRSFEWIQEHVGRPHETLTYIGDNPAKDFIGARKLGWKTIRLRRPGGLHADVEAEPSRDSDRCIGSLDELFSPTMQEWLTEGKPRAR